MSANSLFMKLSRCIRQSWAVGITSLLCTSGIVLFQLPQLYNLKASSQNIALDDQVRQEQIIQLRLNLLNQLPTFGFSNLIADWTLLNFLQYFGDEQARVSTGYQLSPEYFEVILDKDPYFLDAYLFLTASTTLYAGQPERTVSMLNEKLTRLSPKVPNRAYYIWRWKAVDELLFLGDTEAARQSFMTASDWASEYSDQEGQTIAALSRQTADFLETDPDSVEVRIAAWTSVFYNAFDEETQQYIIDQIEKLGADVSISTEGQLEVSLPAKE